MKFVKILLLVIAFALIGTAVYYGISVITKPPIVAKAQNQFTKQLDSLIENIGEKNASQFCKDSYTKCKYYLDDYYKQGRLGITPGDPQSNKQTYDNYRGILYATYANKFVEQAYYVFNGNTWNSDKIKFIRTELKALQKEGKDNSELSSGSDVDNKFKEMERILKKYDEITAFIHKCNNLSVPPVGAISDRYDTSEPFSLISQASLYESNQLDNRYVNNCQRLHDELKKVPEKLFNVHVSFLQNKIDKYGPAYYSYPSQRDYKEAVTNPITSEIDAINSLSYQNPASFQSSRTSLKNALSNYANQAYNYFISL